MRPRIIFLLPILLCLASTCQKCQKHHFEREHLLVESSFEGSDPFEDWANDQHCCDYSLAQSTDQFTEGKSSLRLEVRSTDPMTSGSIRSELTQPADNINTERWYGFKMYLKDWKDDAAGEHVFQWHPSNGTGSATAALWTSGGRYLFVTNNNGGTSGNEYNDLGPIISNKWVSWVIHVRWTDNNTGILQVWKNGSLMYDKNYVKTSPPEGVYFKLGINKFGWGTQTSSTTERILYFDEVRIGNESARYDDVKPN
jgi:hypothetical protein